jgi:hypothetical protein
MDEKTRAAHGFAGVKDVTRKDVQQDNTMQVIYTSFVDAVS